MENGIIFNRGVKPGVIAKRSLRPHFSRLHITFENEIDVCGHFELNGFTANKLDCFLSQEASKEQFVQSVRQRCSCREGVNRVATECDCDWHAFTAFVITFAVARAYLMKLPMHCGRGLVIDLHPVNADVARAGLRVARMHIWQGNETPAVFWPAFENRKIPQRKGFGIAKLVHDFLARCFADRFWTRMQQMDSLL